MFGLALVAVMALSLVARLWQIDWDHRQHLHPDERFWSLTSADLQRSPAPQRHGTALGPVLNYLDGDRSTSNPYRVKDSFVYGPVTLSATRAVASWLHGGATSGRQPALFVVRSLDSAGIPLLDDQGRPRFDAGYDVDLIGRLLLAALDTATVAVVALTTRRLAGRRAGIIAAFLYGSFVLAMQSARVLGSEPLLSFSAALTLCFALRLVTNRGARTAVLAGTAAGLCAAAKLNGAVVIAVPIAAVVAGQWGRKHAAPRTSARLLFRQIALVVAAAAIAFRVGNPAAFQGLGISLHPKFLADVRLLSQLQSDDLPPSIQWADRVPIWFGLSNLIRWRIGPGGVLAATAGVLFVARSKHAAHRANLAVLSTAVLVPLTLGLRTTNPTGRYFVTILPAVAVLGGTGVARLFDTRSSSVARTVVQRSVAVAAVLGASVWGGAYVGGIAVPVHTRVEASRWIAANIPQGQTLTSEAWDDGLPLRVDGIDPVRWNFEQLSLFGTDSREKTLNLAAQLARVDYVVESSNRVWGATARIPARYPSTIAFFQHLDGERLGFRRVATFTRSLRLGPLRISEQGAEEAFSVYDHPEVRIWRNVAHLDPATIAATLDPEAADAAITVPAVRGHSNALMLRPAALRQQAGVSTFAKEFSGPRGDLAVALLWLLALELLGLAAFVVLYPLLSFLPDAGWGVSKFSGLALVAVPVWMIGAWGLRPVSTSLFLTIAGGLLVCACIVGVRCRAALRSVVSARWRVITAAEIVTLAALLTMLLLRRANPDLWHPYLGGEKLFELADLTSVLRTRVLPPPDPWFSGGTLNYYYLGWFVLSVPARIFRTAPEIALNLMISISAAATAGALFSLGTALRSAINPTRRAASEHAIADEERIGSASIRAGVTTVWFVMALANLAVLREGLRSASQTFDWWGVSRVIPASTAITEFPMWSFLFGDLHPHVMDLSALAFLLLFALVLAHWLRSDAASPAAKRARSHRVVAAAAIVGLAVGLVQGTNTWDFPLALVIAVGALFAGRTPSNRVLLGAAASTSAVAAAVCWAPYRWRGEVFDAGFEWNRIFTPIGSWGLQFGLFAAITVLAASTVPRSQSRLGRSGRTTQTSSVALTFALGIAVGVIARSVAAERLVLCANIALAGAALIGARRSRQADAPERVTPFLLCSLGWAVLASVEVFNVANDAGRTNTVFKFWYQAWFLLGIASAALVARPRTAKNMPSTAASTRRITVDTLVTVALLASAVFAQRGGPPRLDVRINRSVQGFDGLAFLDASPPATTESGVSIDRDRPLIEWLRSNVAGYEAVAEAPGADYRWSGRVAALTGLPSVLGWEYHQRQQRRPYGAQIDRRRDDLLRLYRDADDDAVRQTLLRYGIGFVVIGSAEQTVASSSQLARLSKHPCLDAAFTSGAAAVLRVDDRCLLSTEATALQSELPDPTR